MRATVWTLLKLAITLGLLGLVIWKTGLYEPQGQRKFLELLTNVDMVFLLLSFVAGALLNIISSWKWCWLLRERGVNEPFWRLLALYYVGRFYNMFLPTSVGGDVARVYGLGIFTGKHMEAAASVIVDRLSGFLTLLALACVILLMGISKIDNTLVTLGIVVSVAGALFVWWALVSQTAQRVLDRLFGRFRWLSGLLEKLGRLRDTLAGYNTRTIVLVALGLSMLFYAMAIANVYVSARAFIEAPGIYDIALSVPIIMVIMNLPVSIGGIGLMESAYTFVFDVVGLGVGVGLSTALLMRVKTIIDALIGGVLHLLLKK